MATRFRDFKLSEYLNIIWPFAVVAAIGTAIRIVEHWFPRHILEVLGDDLIIAGVLGITLEIFAMRFLIERVATDVTVKLAGGSLPKKLQALIREVVNTTHFVREDYVKSYRFSESDGKGYVSVDVTIHFKVKNYSDSTMSYSPGIQEETFYSPEFKYMEYGIAGESQVLTEEQILRMTTVDPETHVKSLFGPPINLVSIHADSKAHCEVVLKYRLKMREEYSDVTSFGGATLGATIELDYIPEILEFVSGSHDAMRHTPNSNTWHFDRPFINGQHIRAWWFRRTTTVSFSNVRTS